MSMEESISLEETNKIRISLGLKPLTDDKAPVLDSEKIAEDNYAKLREQETKKRETQYVADLPIFQCVLWHALFSFCLGKSRRELRSKSSTQIYFIQFHGCIGFFRLRPPFMVLFKCLYINIY
jgi:hypothetical protein